MPIRLTQVKTAQRLNLELISGELESTAPVLTNPAMRERLTLIRGEGMKKPTQTEAYNAGVLKVSDMIDNISAAIRGIEADLDSSSTLVAMMHAERLTSYRNILLEHRYSAAAAQILTMFSENRANVRSGILEQLRHLQTVLRSTKQDPT